MDIGQTILDDLEIRVQDEICSRGTKMLQRVMENYVTRMVKHAYIEENFIWRT